MASVNKQQKRAKRAKAKAKQLRINGRTPIAMHDDPNAPGEPMPQYLLDMFARMREAETSGRHEMLMELLNSLSAIINDHPDLLDLENADDEAMAATHLAADMLIDYRMWLDNLDRESAQRWLEDPQVIADISTALDTYRQALEAVQ
ncbi:hypothetical protein [Pseudomonas sp. Irchel 3E20]|uniref:hypothetical protein n=1 Tax=Pseudomonas sp. Irchel 3E20 TaxID=2008983 RepID=UPI000BA44729|nr:hypothetical protein [Pseudomonas sp. Irchel 3E20]